MGGPPGRLLRATVGPFLPGRQPRVGLSCEAMRELPSRWEGFSPRLRKQSDLLDKLQADLARLERDPGDDYAAWDFFVTAEHMRDWNQARGLPKMGRDAPLLLLVSDLANHGKHFRTDDPRLTNVGDAIGSTGAFQADAFDPRVFDTVRLVIDLVDPPRTESAVDLARRVVAWWVAELA